MKTRELRNLAFVFVNDCYIEENGELIGIRADYLNEFRVSPLDFDSSDLKHGTYLYLANKKILNDRIRREEISEEEIFSGNKKMIWLSYPIVKRYNDRIWMRLRVTNVPNCTEEVLTVNRQRVLCTTKLNELDRVLRTRKPKRLYVLSSLMSGLVPIIFPSELKRYFAPGIEKLFLGFSSRYKSFVIFPFRCRKCRKKT